MLTSRCVPFDKSFESILYGHLRTEMLDTPHISYDVMCINTIQNMTLVLFGSSTSTDHPIGLKQLKKVHESCLIKCALHAGMLWHNQLESARKSWVFCHFLPTQPPYPKKLPRKSHQNPILPSSKLQVGGWTTPFEKYAQVKLDHFPKKIGVKIKNLWSFTT